jgi:hypothetical protein
MLRWRKRLTPGRLAPIAWRCRAPFANSALRSSHIHLDGHRRRRSRQSPIEDHLHPAIPLVALAEVLVEPRSVTPHNDEPVRQFATGKHLLDDPSPLAESFEERVQVGGIQLGGGSE